MMFDASSYHGWHGITPMVDFFRESDPDMFLVAGSGVYVTDQAGRSYLDARSSMWNVTLGYSCQPVKDAMCRQLDALPSGTVMRYEQPTACAAEYAERLAAQLPSDLDYVRLGNTGSQMTESAAMLSRFYRRMTGQPQRKHIIALHSSYHGTGPLATALTGEPILHDYSAPVDPLVLHAPAPDPVECSGACAGECIAAVVALIERAGLDRVSAVILEPLMGTYIRAAPRHYLSRLLDFCRAKDIHLIVDEVTTGAGRVGAMTMCERLGVAPDMIVLGKGLSSGYFPLAALGVHRSIYDALYDPKEIRLGFPNGSTTDGHHLGAAAGLAVLDILTTPGFFKHVNEMGQLLADAIVAECGGTVRGEGLMLGLELSYADGQPWSVADIDNLRLSCRDHGLLTSYSDGVMPLLPPLTITGDECHELARRLGAAVRAYQPTR